MAGKRPLLAILGKGPIIGSLLGQRERGPIVGALLRMRPETRGALIRDMAINILTLGAGRMLEMLVDVNIREALGIGKRAS